MSSVGSSSGSGRSQDDTIRTQREAYQEREAQLQKRHAQEMRRINDLHIEEMNKLQDGHRTQLEELKKLSQKSISDRDDRYQKEISAVRNANRLQQQRMAEEIHQQEKTEDQRHDQEIKRITKANDQRINLIREANEQAVHAQAEQTNRIKEEAQESQKGALVDQRKKLSEAHGTEKGALIEDFEDRLRDLKREKDAFRQTYTNQKEQMEDRHLREKSQIHDALMGTIRENETRHNQNFGLQREGFDAELGKVKGKFALAEEARAQSSEKNFRELKSDVNSRYEGKLRNLERDVRQEALQRQLDQTRLHRQGEIEKQHLQDAFMDQVRVLESQRGMLMEQGSQLNNREIANAKKEGERNLQKTIRFYQEKISDDRVRSEEARGIETDLAQHKFDQLESTSTKRINAITNQNVEIQRKIQEDFRENVDGLKAMYHDKLNEQREVHKQERQELERRFISEVREFQKRQDERLSNLRSSYESKLSQIKDENLRSGRQRDEYEAKKDREAKKLHTMEMEAREIKYREQMDQLRGRHEEELKMMERRHQAQIDRMSVGVRKI